MSNEIIEIDDVEWENVARRIFYECLASSSTSSISSFSSLSSTNNRVTVKTLVDYIRNHASGNYRSKHLLDELQKSIEDVSWDGQVNYTLFKKASRCWLAKLQQHQNQDGNNNMTKDDSRSDDEKQNSAYSSDNDRDFCIIGERYRKPKTPRKSLTTDFVDLLNVSSYSPSSDTTHGCAMSDTTPESADDTDSGCGVTVGIGEISQIDLRMRVRRFDEENSLLREDLIRAEELAAGLQRQLENLRQKLDQTKEKCRQLERENDEHQEMLQEAEEKQRDCRWALQKLEKEKNSLEKKLEDTEMEKQQISALNAKLEKCKKEKYECMKEATVCKRELEDKQRDCELLREQLAQLNEANKSLQESYDKSIQRLREKVQELKKEKFVLCSPNTVGTPSDGKCPTTPIGYMHPYVQISPCNDDKLHDSLYDELKAFGFSAANESRVRELENELSLYEEEIHQALCQINRVMEQLCQNRSTPHVPDLDLNNLDGDKFSQVSLLLQKISDLSIVVNEIIWRPKVKDASSQLCLDTNDTNKLLSTEFGIRSFDDQLQFLKEKTEHEEAHLGNSRLKNNEDVFVDAFSVNQRSLGKRVERVGTSTETVNFHSDNFSTPPQSSMASLGIQEHTIIEPIVQELDRIIQCANKREEESTIDSSTSKNPRYRSIYTTVDNTATDSTLNSPKRDLASTYVLSSGGDGLSRGTINDTRDWEMTGSTAAKTKIILRDNSLTDCTESLTESMLKNESLESTKITSTSTIPEESVDSELVVEAESPSKFLDSPSQTSIISEQASTPRNANVIGSTEKIIKSSVITNYRETPYVRNLPKRKISVFHRSFDIDTVQDETEEGIGSSTYRLTERSMSTPGERDKSLDDGLELDPERVKMTINTRKFLLNYRDKNEESDSEDSLSPLKSMDHRDDYNRPEVTANRQSCRPITLAPGKLNLSSLPETSVCVDKTESLSGLNDVTKNVDSGARPGETEASGLEETSEKNREASSILLSNDEIDRGVTYRKKSFSRELDFSEFSLLSLKDRPEDQVVEGIKEKPWKIVVSMDGDSTFRDSMPKRQLAVARKASKLPVSSKCAKPQIRNRVQALRDSPKSRGSRHDRGEEAIFGYEARSAESYGGVAAESRDGQDDGTNVSATVALAMSSGEDTSDSECGSMAIRDNDNDRRNVGNETRSISPTVLNFVDGALLGTSTPAPTNNNNSRNNNNFDKPNEVFDRDIKKSMAQKRDKRERPHTIRRSLSESGCGRSECRCHLTNFIPSNGECDKRESPQNAFPSLTDVRLQESGIAKLNNNDELGGNLAEADLERKYMALSVGLVTDRVTLPRRVALSIRQRDQSEKNLACEVQKMHRDIQDLAPLCIDRESVERVERVRHQLDMIAQCAHRVSCTAETLGAVHQENRISRAILLADRYLLVLRSRCDKLAIDLSETKRILTEHNIVVEELCGELGDDMPRARYRGVPITNRTMMARRRASIATIFRPLSNLQDVTKDGLRQRNSVSGRVTLRRPSLSAESQKWEAEKLDRTDSSSSIGELREIFEQAESRRNSREENNNVLRLHSSIRDFENGETDVWTNAREETLSELPVIVDECYESEETTQKPHWSTKNHTSWKTILWCVIISFFFGFYVKHVVSSSNECSGAHFKWWSIEEILGRYLPVENESQRPI